MQYDLQRNSLVSNSVLAFVGLSFAVSTLTGCGRPEGLVRVVVSGAITMNGRPIEDGQIRYLPLEKTVGPITIARITDGQYVCEDKGGVPIGKHRVEIFAWDPKLPLGGRGEPTRPQLLPEKYNENSELVELVKDSGGPLEINFNL